jgi:hypothetical protein
MGNRFFTAMDEEVRGRMSNLATAPKTYERAQEAQRKAQLEQQFHSDQPKKVRSGDVYRYFEFLNDGFREFLIAESKRGLLPEQHTSCFRYERMARLRIA